MLAGDVAQNKVCPKIALSAPLKDTKTRGTWQVEPPSWSILRGICAQTPKPYPSSTPVEVAATFCGEMDASTKRTPPSTLTLARCFRTIAFTGGRQYAAQPARKVRVPSLDLVQNGQPEIESGPENGPVHSSPKNIRSGKLPWTQACTS